MRIIREVNGRLLLGALVGAVAALLVTLALSYRSNRIRVEANSDRIDKLNRVLASQCIQREDLDQHIHRTQDLLNATRGDPKVFGIPRIVIVETQRQDLLLRRSLEILPCPKKGY